MSWQRLVAAPLTGAVQFNELFKFHNDAASIKVKATHFAIIVFAYILHAISLHASGWHALLHAPLYAPLDALFHVPAANGFEEVLS